MVGTEPGEGVAWITGASSGLGRALALRLAARGWTVAVSARRAEELDRLAEESGGRAVAYPLDATDREAVHDAVARIECEQGPIALAVLNAGTNQPVSARDFDAGVVRKLIDLNFLAAVDGLEALLPRMRGRDGGRIAVVASVAGYRGLPTAAGYCASKAALIGLAEALRPELERDGIVLQMVNPGFVKTPLTDRNTFKMPMLMDVEDAAAALERGLRSDRFEIVFPWLFCMGMKLYRILPHALVLRLARRMVPKS